MPKLKAGHISPTDAEDAVINAGIAADPDTPEWSGQDFAGAIPFTQLAESLQTKLRGRPKAEETKTRITIRLSRDVVARFRATGAGWQTRMDAALRDWLEQHRS